MNKRLLYTRLALTSSLVYILLVIYYFFYLLKEIQLHSDTPSYGSGFGMLLAFMFPHLCTFILALVFNIICSFKNVKSKVLIILTIVFYSIAGYLGGLFIFYLYFTVLLQIILLIIAIFYMEKRG